jgi:hypothetical protein
VFVKIEVSPRKGKPIQITLKGGDMVQPIEARGHRSICTLLDLTDWDAAVGRLKEIGVTIKHHKNKPVVNVEEVKEASKRWFKRRNTHSNTT